MTATPPLSTRLLLPFQTVLEPDGELGHWMRIDGRLKKAAGVAAGDTATVEVVGSRAGCPSSRRPGSASRPGPPRCSPRRPSCAAPRMPIGCIR